MNNRFWWQIPTPLPLPKELSLPPLLRSAPRTALERLEAHWRDSGNAQSQELFAELSHRFGISLENDDRREALAWHLVAASACSQDVLDPSKAHLLATYNRATERVALLYRVLSEPGHGSITVSASRRTFVLRLGDTDQNGRMGCPDRLIAAREWSVRGLHKRFRQDGVGAAFAAFWSNDQSSRLSRHYPPEGIVQPATAVLLFSNATAASTNELAELTFHDTRRISQARLNGPPLRLAADFTLPWATLLAETGDLWESRKIAVYRPEESPRQHQLYLMEPYDPNRIPVLMIHGLRSTPLVWQEITNEIMGDPELRMRYQVWHYLYPTGLPIFHNAAIMRDQVDEVRALLDPDGDDFATQNIIVLGHSMGGLLARTLVTDSGDDVWNAMVSRPADQLSGDPADIQEFRRRLYFTPKPYVKRVIFIAVPHRGSTIADGVIGRLASWRIELPIGFRELFARLADRNPGLWTPAARSLFVRGAPSSVSTLSPSAIGLKAMADLPVSRSIPFHSILGDRGIPAGENSSDGVVAHWSSHLDGAESEMFVPSGHEVPRHPRCIEEVARILKAHPSSR